MWTCRNGLPVDMVQEMVDFFGSHLRDELTHMMKDIRSTARVHSCNASVQSDSGLSRTLVPAPDNRKAMWTDVRRAKSGRKEGPA